MQAFLQLEHKEYMAKMNNLPNHHGVGPIQLNRLKAGPGQIHP